MWRNHFLIIVTAGGQSLAATDQKPQTIMFTVENIIPASLYGLNNASVNLSESPSFPTGTPISPVNIIQEGQTAYAHFKWEQSGWLIPIIAPGCQFECRVYLERMGAGEVGDPTPATVNFVPSSTQTYNAVVPMTGLTEGAYKVVATLLMRGPAGLPTPIASYQEIGVLQVYKAI